MVKRYLQFINEANEEVQKVDSSKYTEIKDEIKSMIEKTIENSGGEFESFVDKFVKEPEDVKIEGLINDSDLYDFYLKFRNDIDEILNIDKEEPHIDYETFINHPSSKGIHECYEKKKEVV